MDLKAELKALIGRVEKREGTSTRGAIRDVLTDIAHICHEEGIDFDERCDTAIEVAQLEVEDAESLEGVRGPRS